MSLELQPETKFNFDEAIFIARFIKDLGPSMGEKYYAETHDRFTSIFNFLKKAQIKAHLKEVVYKNQPLSVVLDCAGFIWSFQGCNGVEETFKLYGINNSEFIKLANVDELKNPTSNFFININCPDTIEKDEFILIDFNFQNKNIDGISPNFLRIHYQFGGHLEPILHQQIDIDEKLNSFLNKIENNDLKIKTKKYEDIPEVTQKQLATIIGKKEFKSFKGLIDENIKTHEFLIKNHIRIDDEKEFYSTSYYRWSLCLNHEQKEKEFIKLYSQHILKNDNFYLSMETPYSKIKLNEINNLESYSFQINSKWVSLDNFLDVAYIRKWGQELEIAKNITHKMNVKNSPRF